MGGEKTYSESVSPPEISSYFGLDQCEQWNIIHEYISSLFPSTNVSFKTGPEANLESYLDKEGTLDGYNVLILSYLVSILYRIACGESKKEGADADKYAIDKMENFYNKLIDKVIIHRAKDTPMLIIFNDINGYQSYQTFINMINNKEGLTIKGTPVKQYFANQIHENKGNIPEDFTIVVPPKNLFDNLYNDCEYSDLNGGSLANYQGYYCAMKNPQSYQLILEIEKP